MAANQARELLQICSLSCDSGCIIHRGPWPGPSALPLGAVAQVLRTAGAGCRALRAAAALLWPGGMLPPKGLLCPSLTIRHLTEFVLPAPPCPVLPAQISDLSRRGNPGIQKAVPL